MLSLGRRLQRLVGHQLANILNTLILLILVDPQLMSPSEKY